MHFTHSVMWHALHCSEMTARVVHAAPAPRGGKKPIFERDDPLAWSHARMYVQHLSYSPRSLFAHIGIMLALCVRSRSGVQGMADNNQLANPALPADVLAEAVPGNIRRAEHFVSFLRKVSRACHSCCKHHRNHTSPSSLQKR